MASAALQFITFVMLLYARLTTHDSRYEIYTDYFR